jgi:UDP-N-acetyl-D-mannosaminuronic acid dehydrogenase
MRISFVGLGYIGLPTAVVVANNGYKVFGIDIDHNLVDDINTKKIEIVEPGLNDQLEKVVDNGNFKAYTDIQTADVYLVVVPTPFKGDYQPDLKHVKAAIQSLIPFFKKGDLVIIESTCPVGTTEQMINFICEERPELKDQLYLAYCPERVLPGNVLHELVHNDRVIGGINEESTIKATEFYRYFVEGELHQTNARTAEMCKLTENASRDAQIAFANELSIICDKAKINVYELIELANKHPRVNLLQPGTGVGGHCIAVDPYFIASAFPKESVMIKTSRIINDNKTQWCLEKIIDEVRLFETENGYKPSVALMGLAFKPDIDDLRESPALIIVKELCAMDLLTQYFVVEPNIRHSDEFELVDFKIAHEEADIVVFLVAHKQFKKLPNLPNKRILDFCGVKKQGWE